MNRSIQILCQQSSRRLLRTSHRSTYHKLNYVVRRCASSRSGLQDVVIVSAVRTPIGSIGGSLSPMSVTDLGACVIKETVKRSGVTVEAIDDCYMGLVLGAGARQTPSRQALLKAGLPDTIESTTINKACASGMKAVMIAAQTIMLGHQDVVIAGGMESMSNAPFLLPRKTTEWKEKKLLDSLFYDGFEDPWLGILMGNCCENNNRNMGITREEQDDFCIQSYERTAASWAAGILSQEVVPVQVKTRHKTYEFAEDEEYKNYKPEKIRTLPPAFEKGGSVTAANSSKMNDGACALVLMSSEAAEDQKIKPLARIVSFADAATQPIDFPVAPVLAMEKLLKQTGVKKDDVTMWEINEAFSGVVVADIKLMDLDPSKVNIHGGAVSLGHPVGSSGARCVTHLTHSLAKGQLGVGSICNGGGAASAILIEGL